MPEKPGVYHALRLIIPNRRFERLRRVAFDRRISMSEIIRRGLDKEVSRLERLRKTRKKVSY